VSLPAKAHKQAGNSLKPDSRHDSNVLLLQLLHFCCSIAAALSTLLLMLLLLPLAQVG
jgi:hypothetical protein